MQIDYTKRLLRIGIREFVSFAQSSYPATPLQNLGNWRTALGQQWHQQLWQETARQYGEQARAEVSLEGYVDHAGWTFHLSGRIDQLIQESDHLLLREIKTTQHLLPIPTETLRERYPDYLEQLACYELLLPAHLPDPALPIEAELLLLHIDTGIRQCVQLPERAMDTLQIRLDTWVDFLEGQRLADERIRHLIVPQVFARFREDQIPIREQLFASLPSTPTPTAPAAKRRITLEAATGFGKTGIAIEWALQALQQRQVDRVIYLTGKNTGQQQVVQELARLQSDSPGLRFFQIRNQAEHHRICPHPVCPCQDRTTDEHPALLSYLPFPRVEALLRGGSPDMESIGLCASSYQVCPRLVSQSALAQSEFWIADYNYLFAPSARNLLESLPGFDPTRTLLIIDEAHNLHERTCANFSVQISSYRCQQIATALNDLRSPRSFPAALNALGRFVDALNEGKPLDTTQRYHLLDLLESIHRHLCDHGRWVANLPESLWEPVWQLELAWQSLRNEQLELLPWSSRHGSLNLSCIDASAILRSTLEGFPVVLFMTATFPPMQAFAREIGLQEQDLHRLHAASEWRNACYQVAIDTRVNTSYRNRERHYHCTAQTLEQYARSSLGPVISFFPSYRYAEAIARYLEVIAPELRVFALEPGLAGDDLMEHIEQGLQQHDILCLPLGSSLSEGIDLLGGRVENVMVVSPALPEFNPVQEARNQSFADQRDGFRNAYQIPGMTKVNQALGRLVRSPEHRARVLLHCERFAQPDFRALLAREYQEASVLRNERDLQHWLVRGW